MHFLGERYNLPSHPDILKCYYVIDSVSIIGRPLDLLPRNK